MKRSFALAAALVIGLALSVAGPAIAQKKHAPKGVWTAMVAGLTDIQSITAALAVFDMKRAEEIADGLVKREVFISTIERLPQAVRDGHAKVADAAKELAAAAHAGDEMAMSTKIGGVLAACSACHYNVRDAERRKEMK